MKCNFQQCLFQITRLESTDVQRLHLQSCCLERANWTPAYKPSVTLALSLIEQNHHWFPQSHKSSPPSDRLAASCSYKASHKDHPAWRSQRRRGSTALLAKNYAASLSFLKTPLQARSPRSQRPLRRYLFEAAKLGERSNLTSQQSFVELDPSTSSAALPNCASEFTRWQFRSMNTSPTMRKIFVPASANMFSSLKLLQATFASSTRLLDITASRAGSPVASI